MNAGFGVQRNYIGMVATMPKLLGHSWKQGFGAHVLAILARMCFGRIDFPDFHISKKQRKCLIECGNVVKCHGNLAAMILSLFVRVKLKKFLFGCKF